MKSVVAVVTLMVLSSGCTHFFKGVVPELDEQSDIKVLRSQSSYGDCFRVGRPVPVLYGVDRPAYQLRVVQGDRYWPQLLLVATNSSGAMLDIVGDGIYPLEEFAAIRRIVRDRGTNVSHRIRFNLPLWSTWEGGVRKYPALEAVGAGRVGPTTVNLAIRDAAGRVVGEERFTYRLSVIQCKELDGP
jgi:hypothetical protein